MSPVTAGLILAAVLFAASVAFVARAWRRGRADRLADLGSGDADPHWPEVRGQLGPPPASWRDRHLDLPE